MDCTPNLALELIEQLLSGENTGFTPKFGTIPLAEGALEPLRPSQVHVSDDGGTKLRLKPDEPLSKFASPARPSPAESPSPEKAEQSTSGLPKLKLDLDLPPSKGTAPTRPAFANEREGVASPKPTTRPSFASSPPPAPAPPPERSEPIAPDANIPAKSAPVESSSGAGPDFRIEIRQDFLKRVPQIQAELRDRVGALIKSKSTTDQLKLLKELEVSVSSLASLSGITGFSRVSHLSGALDALIKDLHKKPNQMTASVLRSIAHAMDCLNVLFRDLTQLPQEIPQSMLILVVDDEPISRRTIAVALGKANLRCIGMEDSKVALTVLQENTFDLIFLDAEMPGLNGFELCAELRKLPTNKSTPVIFVTSLTKFETRTQSSLSGGNDLIAKPFLMMELAVKALTYLLKPPVTSEARILPAEPAE
jgi:CheY-like chemotaxis protein